jgi:hypothetical protein
LPGAALTARVRAGGVLARTWLTLPRRLAGPVAARLGPGRARSGSLGTRREGGVVQGFAGREGGRLPRADPGRAARPGAWSRRARSRACRWPRPAVTWGHILGPLPRAAGSGHGVAGCLAERTRRRAGALHARYTCLLIGSAARGSAVTPDATSAVTAYVAPAVTAYVASDVIAWVPAAGRSRHAALGACPRRVEGDVSRARTGVAARRTPSGVAVARVDRIRLGVHVGGVQVRRLRRASPVAGPVVRAVEVAIVKASVMKAPAGAIPAPGGRAVAVRVVRVPLGLWGRGGRGPASRAPAGAAAWTFHPAPPGHCAMPHTPHDECRPQDPRQRGRRINGLIRWRFILPGRGGVSEGLRAVPERGRRTTLGGEASAFARVIWPCALSREERDVARSTPPERP